MIRSRNARHPLLAAFALIPLAIAGCNDINTGKDQQTGRGNGDQLPAQGGASAGTNATTGQITTEGPGSKVVGEPVGNPSQSTPYGGNGAGATPPVTPSANMEPSGESNSGQATGSKVTPGSDASTEGAKINGNNGGPGTGEPPQ